jgi:hypothetical protein
MAGSASSALSTEINREQDRIANLDMIVVDLAPNRADDTCAFVAENCWRICEAREKVGLPDEFLFMINMRLQLPGS